MFSMTLTQSNSMQEGIKKSLEDLRRRIPPAMRAAGETLLEESNKLVPVLTGVLKKSGKVTYKGRGLNTEFSIGYSADYAVYVHEDLTKHHPNGQAKFLETAILQNQDKLGVALVTNL